MKTYPVTVQLTYSSQKTILVRAETEEWAKRNALSDLRWDQVRPEVSVVEIGAPQNETPDIIKLQQVVQSLREEAEVYKRQGDKEMYKVFMDDWRCLKKVFTQYKQKRYKKAYQIAWILDTAVRESIPDECWDIIEKAGELP
jgi:hypothetical protein